MKHSIVGTTVCIVISTYLLVGGISLSQSDFPLTHDDGIYAITARSLCETGEYRIISLPGEPQQQKYPVVFPAILSVIWRIWPNFPQNILPMKAVSLFGGAAFLAFSFLLLRRWQQIGDFKAVVIVAICAAAPATCELANNVMSELVFGALTMAALWLLDRELQTTKSLLTGIAIGGIAGAAFLTRSVGVALLVAMIWGLIWQRNWRLLSMTALGMLLVVIPIKVWEPAGSPVGRPYEYYVNYGDWFRHTAVEVGPMFLVWVPIKNVLYSVVGLSGTMWPSKIGIFPAGYLLNAALLASLVAGAFAILFAIIGLFSRVWQRTPSIWALYLACYLVLLLTWPFPPPPRFFVPVLPLIMVTCYEGVSRTEWLVLKPFRLLFVGICLLVFSTSCVLSAIERIRVAKIPIKLDDHYLWIIDNSSPADVIACLDDTKCYFMTGRKSVSIGIPEFAAVYGPHRGYRIRPETIREMLSESQAKFLMVEGTNWPKPLEQLAFDAVERLNSEHPALLDEVWRDPREGAVIYRVSSRDPQKSLVAE